MINTAQKLPATTEMKPVLDALHPAGGGKGGGNAHISAAAPQILLGRFGKHGRMPRMPTDNSGNPCRRRTGGTDADNRLVPSYRVYFRSTPALGHARAEDARIVQRP